nr:BREX system ATP-binding domain-containing protein [uncultured Blautia sp.]
MEEYNMEDFGADTRKETPYMQLAECMAPDDGSMLEELSAGVSFLTDFWQEKYLQEYIKEGGSKIKFVSGRKGSGKSHLLKLTAHLAEQENYVTAAFSAKDIWIHDFREIYVEVLRQSDLLECLERCSHKIIENCGFDYREVPEDMTFMDYLSRENMADAITRREIRLQLKSMFLENPLIDNNFALACSLLTGGILGHPLLEEQNKELLLGWLAGDRSVKITSLRSLGLSPARITRVNARHMLRSLAQVIHMAGYSGLLVTVDDMEILLSRSSLEPLHYTKLKREDTYESIRQLIDDIDTLKNIMFIFAFDRELLDNDKAGIKSYQALWMRIQSEIVSQRFNCFTDIVDMDRLAAQEYTEAVAEDMWEKLARCADRGGIRAAAVDREKIKEILIQSKVGAIGIPGLVNRAVLGGEE